MSQAKTLKPTESELEILQVLWDKKEASVRQVHESLQAIKDVGYTTTLKLMQIMYEKGLVVRNDESRTHIYKSNVNREQMQNQLLTKMISNVFGGSYSQLVMQALGNNKVSDEELEKISALINSMKHNA